MKNIYIPFLALILACPAVVAQVNNKEPQSTAKPVAAQKNEMPAGIQRAIKERDANRKRVADLTKLISDYKATKNELEKAVIGKELRTKLEEQFDYNLKMAKDQAKKMEEGLAKLKTDIKANSASGAKSRYIKESLTAMGLTQEELAPVAVPEPKTPGAVIVPPTKPQDVLVKQEEAVK